MIERAAVFAGLELTHAEQHPAGAGRGVVRDEEPQIVPCSSKLLFLVLQRAEEPQTLFPLGLNLERLSIEADGRIVLIRVARSRSPASQFIEGRAMKRDGER